GLYGGALLLDARGTFIHPPPAPLTYIDEPMSWESVVASVQFDASARTVQTISFRPIVLNPIGDGQPDVHNAYADNEFLHTRGLPAPATGARAGYILQRLAGASRTFGTAMEIKGEVGTVRLGGR